MKACLAAGVAALVLTLSGAAQAQSFNCRGDLQPDEQAICDDAGLAQLDIQMNNMYRRAMANATPQGRRTIREYQRDWLASRSSCGSNRACLRQSYRDQIAWLRQYD
jgi:uncharacterized protein